MCVCVSVVKGPAIYPILKVLSFFCLKLKISITTELIGFSVLVKLHVDPVMVSGYFIFILKSWDSFELFCFQI